MDRSISYRLLLGPLAASSASVLVLDEAGFLEGAEEIYTAAMPTLSMVGDKAVIVVSTPNTSNDFFGRLWHGTDGDWNKVKIHDSEHPIYGADPNWATDTRICGVSMAAWNLEYELESAPTPRSTGAGTEMLHRHLARVRQHPPRLHPCDRPQRGRQRLFRGWCWMTEDPIEVVGYYRENGRSTQYSLTKIGELIENFQPRKVICEHQAMLRHCRSHLTAIPEISDRNLQHHEAVKITATDRLVYLMENGRLIFPRLHPR